MGVPSEKCEKLLGEAVRHARKEQRLSQEGLAGESGINLTYMGEIERGEKMPSLETLVKVARGLKLSASELLAKAKL